MASRTAFVWLEPPAFFAAASFEPACASGTSSAPPAAHGTRPGTLGTVLSSGRVLRAGSRAVAIRRTRLKQLTNQRKLRVRLEDHGARKGERDEDEGVDRTHVWSRHAHGARGVPRAAHA